MSKKGESYLPLPAFIKGRVIKGPILIKNINFCLDCFHPCSQGQSYGAVLPAREHRKRRQEEIKDKQKEEKNSHILLMMMRAFLQFKEIKN